MNYEYSAISGDEEESLSPHITGYDKRVKNDVKNASDNNEDVPPPAEKKYKFEGAL